MHDRWRRVGFGDFVADLTTGELFKAGVRVPMQQQPFRLLRFLLERPGELVTREELQQRLWPTDTFVAFDRGLTSAMRKVREALGDSARDARYIETLTGRGYRFIADVNDLALPVMAPALDASAAATPAVSHAAIEMPAAAVASPAVSALTSVGWRRWAAAALVVIAVSLPSTFPSPQLSAEARLRAAGLLSDYACSLKAAGRFDEAVAAIREAQTLAPDSAKITAQVGFYLHAARQYEQEFPMFTRALALDDRSPDAWLHLGLGFARRSNFLAAVPALARAAELAHGAEPYQRWLDWAQRQN